MAGVSHKSLDEPDELLNLPLLNADVVEVGGLTVARLVHQPGWRWSTHVKPEVGGEWCRARHLGVVLSGVGHLIFEDGTELDIGAGDVFDIPPGHDGYVVGDEPLVELEWQGFRTFAGGRSRGVLTTLLFTDLVESTSTAARMGDAAWREALAGHYASIRAALDRSGGREINTTGDGILATFDAPAPAIRSAAVIRGQANQHDLHIRAGVHVGEVQLVGDNVQGLAVHEAARVMAAADADEILVSETTRILAAASGLRFEDRGVHELKGVPGERHLFAYVGD